MKNNPAIPFPIITVLSVFIFLFIFLKLFGPIPFFVQNITTTKDSLFSVDGVGEATAVPDIAVISFGVSKTDATVKFAKNQVNEIINKITQNLKNIGADAKDIKTTNYSINPQYDYSEGSRRLTGYTVNTNIQVELQSIDKANEAIDIATQDGATQVGGIQFKINDKKQKELLNEARKKAIKDAKEKAQSLTNAAGIRLGRIVDIKEATPDNSRPFLPMIMEAGEKNVQQSTELSPGENKITTTITLFYEIH